MTDRHCQSIGKAFRGIVKATCRIAAVHRDATFALGAHFATETETVSEITSDIMRKAMPIIMALIPLAAVVGACVAVP
ncbi:hypothetical protein [Sphingomonas baiyangensis]|uniref:Uncharacterized protein n=1 Tax=Sphingomonas baiyangensis TaxID=2572576 RepID=A0A4U1L1I2_9SPHN|nr:hypothetical protein [Sphingomonas baiyangensis]TKD50707.1 hypothetical protein FBR43_07940 [Sphingomonas baiyangensis]